jgi:hypothetical protein
MTPETQGEAFHGQFEIQKITGNELSIDTKNNRVDEGVLYNETPRTGFLFSESIFNQLDLYWSETSSANSMFGAKFQFLGGSRIAKEIGHKLAIAAAVGSNEHETDDRMVEFTLGGTEYMLLYGYRFMEQLMLYSSFSQARYNFNGKIHSSNAGLNGLKPNIDSKIMSVSGGLEASLHPIVGKLEFTYQSIDSDKTKAYSHFLTGVSIGYAW